MLFPVSMSEAHAVAATLSGELTLEAPDGTPLRVRYARHEEYPDGNWSWIGRVEGGDPGREAIITFGEQAVFGSIPQADGSTLRLTTQAGQVYAMTIDPRNFKTTRRKGGPDAMAAPAALDPFAASATSLAASATATTASQAKVTAGATASATNTIDVVLGYTNGYAAGLGGQSAAVTRLQNLIATANAALSNSNVAAQVRLVGTVQVTYTDSNDNGAALNALTGISDSGAPVTIPAALKPLRDARETYGADLVSLVRKFDESENDGCGVAWLNGAGGVAITSSDAAYAYSVVSDGTDRGSDGKTYYCEDHTLAHEMAHNMGSQHDVDNAGGMQGRYPYSYGLKASSTAGNFYTVMAYGDSGQTSYNVFSNPNVTICGGRACGVAGQTDNARSLNLTIPLVSKFRPTIVGSDSVPYLYAISKNDPARTSVVLNIMAGSNNYSSFVTQADINLARVGLDERWIFQVGDYNLDGVIDVYSVKRTSSSGKTEVHILDGASGFSSFSLHAATALPETGVDGRWMFRIADYNRDGRLDLYAIKRSSTSSGRTEVHVLNGADNFKTFLLHAATGLAGTGADYSWTFDLADYNGDGVPDLYAVKKNGSSERTEVHVMDGAAKYSTFLLHQATVLASTGRDNAWEFSVADFDLDGKPDLYVIKKNAMTTGRTEVHIMSGSSKFQAYLLHAATTVPISGGDSSWAFVAR